MGRAFPFLIVFLAAFAFEPLLRAGLTAGDYECLLGPGDGNLMGQAWIALSRALHGVPEPGRAALALRLESLAVLGLAVLGLRAFLVRLLTPWTGPAQAATTAVTAAALALLHPLAVGGVARLEGRGELLALACATWGAALYLRGRQERESLASLGSLALFVTYGFAVRGPLFAALLVVGSEVASARRTRSRMRRLRTAATALVGVELCVHLAVVLGLAPAVRAVGSAEPLLLRAVQALGWLLLPPSTGFLGGAEAFLAAGLAFLALQPVFRAARHAPRLWGALFSAWALALLLASWAPVVGGAESRLDRAGPWLPTALVLASGMGLSASALRGGRGQALRLVLGLASALLAHGNALRFQRAGQEVAEIQRDLAQVPDAGRRVLLLDPPRSAAGVDALGSSLAWLRHPRLNARGPEPFEPARTRSTTRAGFLALTRSTLFEQWRSEGLSVLLPPVEGRRGLVALLEPWTGPEVRPWRASLTQRFEPELDPLRFEGLRLRADLDRDPRQLQRLGWSGRGDSGGSLEGTVRSSGAELEAFFDLSSSLAWRLAGPVRSLVLERAVEPILQGELLRRLPAPEPLPVPSVDGADWWFEPFTEPGVEGAVGVLVLLDLEQLTRVEIVLDRQAERWRARAAERFAAAARRRDATLLWSLEYRVAGQALWRAEGRLP